MIFNGRADQITKDQIHNKMFRLIQKVRGKQRLIQREEESKAAKTF